MGYFVTHIPRSPHGLEHNHVCGIMERFQQGEHPFWTYVDYALHLWDGSVHRHNSPQLHCEGALAYHVEYFLSFHTIEGTHIGKFKVTREFIGPSCKRVAHKPPSKDAYLRGAGNPHMVRWHDNHPVPCSWRSPMDARTRPGRGGRRSER